MKCLHTVVWQERVTNYMSPFTMLHHGEIRSRDIQGLFFSVAQSKNEGRDMEELRQLCTTNSALMLRSKPTLMTPAEKIMRLLEHHLSVN